MLAIMLFHHFFGDSFISKGFFLLFTKFLSFQHNSNKAEIKSHERKGAF
jgi:hypothetical protein